MTPPLLENELVKKYFSCDSRLCCFPEHHCHSAWLILNAMQEPIKNGERCLEWFPSTDKWQEIVWKLYPECEGVYHPSFLRLPDRFQPPPECKDYQSGFYCGKCIKPMNDGSWCECKPPSPAKGPGETCCRGCWKYPEKHDCPCHQPPDSAKCEHAGIAGHHAATNCPCLCCTPAPSAVEAKIEELVTRITERRFSGRNPFALRKQLCDLVALARKEGRNV